MMKRIVRCLAALLIAAMCLSGFAALAENVITTGSVNLRSGAGLSFSILAVIPKGTALSYTETPVKDDRGVAWYKVTYSGKTGWVSSKYAKSGSSSSSSSSSSASGKVTTTGSVNLRSGAGLSYASLAIIKKGTSLSYDATSKDERGVTWYHVSYNGKTGWVSSKYAKSGGSSSSSSSSRSGKVITTGSVNIRAGAGLNYKSIGNMGKGKTATYLGETKKDGRGVAWYKIKYNGKTGWVSSKYSKLG